MGCVYERFEFISPNEVPFTCEEMLGYDSVSLDSFIRDIRKESENDEITWPKLLEVFQTYDICSKHVRDKEMCEGKFYNKFLTEDRDRYSTKKLILLAVLLCPGSQIRKGENIFESFNYNLYLSKSEFSEILKLLLKIALDDLPSYIYDMTKEGNMDAPDMIALYRKRLLRKSATAHSELLYMFPKEALHQQEFLDILKITNLTAICSSSTLRAFVSKMKSHVS